MDQTNQNKSVSDRTNQMSLKKRSISGLPTSSGICSSNINTASNHKVNLGLLRGKSITTSVPMIKFSTRTEEVVEVFSSCCEEEMATAPRRASLTPTDSEQVTLSSTSTSVSDPWRFFSGIKGKITKSVEGKLIEYKNKSAVVNTSTNPVTDDTNRSPCKQHNQNAKQSGSNNNSSSAGNSHSDSEDISESSLSRTQGGLSTTEGAEMSTTEDDDEDEEGTPSQSQHSIAKQSNREAAQSAASPISDGGVLKYRLRTIRNGDTTTTETTVGESFLRALQRLAGDSTAADNDNLGTAWCEQGVDVLQDMELDGADAKATKPLDLHIDNMTIKPNDVIEVREVRGSEIRADLVKSVRDKQSSVAESVVDSRTIFNPTQFVDLRHMKRRFIRIGSKSSTATKTRKYKIQKAICVTVIFLIFYFILSPLSVYLSGFILGVISTLAAVRVRNKWLKFVGTSVTPETDLGAAAAPSFTQLPDMINIIKTASSEGVAVTSLLNTVWMNEWPAVYTPQTYSVSGTQPVHLRLQRHLLKVSNTNARLPKRDMRTSEATEATTTTTTTYTYTRHRIYDLRGATVSLLPVGLTRIRWWSKKYPICVQLTNAEQLTTQEATAAGTNDDEQPIVVSNRAVVPPSVVGEKVFFKQAVRKRRKWHSKNTKDSPIQFSKLMFDDDIEDADSSSSMIETLDLAVPIDDCGGTATAVKIPSKVIENDCVADMEGLLSADSVDDSKTRLYLFARTCRDKETWYQLLTNATSAPPTESLVNRTIVYQNYMDTILSVNQSVRNKDLTASPTDLVVKKPEEVIGGATSEHLVWLNALLGRAWYSYATGGEAATMRLKDRIQRKLATIRLPAFIEELKLSELSISPPKMFQPVPPVRIIWASRPSMDERGIWIDLDLEYESSVVLILQTKLNLMRLKSKAPVDGSDQIGHVRQHSCDSVEQLRSAIFCSDVDDSAESSSDDDSGGDSDKQPQLVADDSEAIPSTGAATAGSPNHKLIRMVDRIADSRLFRAATEYRYVQRALENVRNTDLCLRVEIQSISGRMCVNLPPPPSDRVWFGFRVTPELGIRALPTVGDYHISLQHVTGWLERRLVREFQKVLVLPNMEDIVLPGLR